jgi:hypothetical protein
MPIPDCDLFRRLEQSPQEILLKLERRAEANFTPHWENLSKYQCIPSASGEIDEMKLPGEQEVVIATQPRLHSRSPSPLTSQVSHIRTQHLHQAQPHVPTQIAVENFLSAQFSGSSSATPSSITYPSFNSPINMDTFNFDMEESFLSSNVPSYEQIMQIATTDPRSSMRTQPFQPPLPDPSFHSGYQGALERFDQGVLPSRGQTLDTLASSAEFDGDGRGESVWGSFVGDLMRNSSSQYPPYGM